MTLGIYDSAVPRPLPFLSTPRRLATTHFGMRLSLLIETHRYTRRVKEVIHVRLHCEIIDRDKGIEIPEAWILKIAKHNTNCRLAVTS